MKIKFNSDDNLTLNKKLKYYNLTVIVRSIFEEDGNYYPQFFFKTNASKECDIYHYWCILDKGIKYELFLSNGCHNLMQKAVNFNDVTIVSIKGNDYRIHFWYISKVDATNIMKN